MTDPVTSAIADCGVVAILRARSAEHFPAIVDMLVAEGIRAIEVTLTASDALPALTALCAEYAGTAIVGAGTVITTDQAAACIDAGSTFLVSPAGCPDVVAAGLSAGVAVYPGALTPTEILNAHRGGASAVKLFPASAVGPKFISDVHGPFPDIAIMPTGGISIDTVGTWLRAGAVAVGMGSPLIGAATTEGADASLRDRARRAVAAVAEARSS